MDIKEKLDEIHNEVKDLRRENTESHGSIYTVLVSIRDNMWHQYKSIHDFLRALFAWNKP